MTTNDSDTTKEQALRADPLPPTDPKGEQWGKHSDELFYALTHRAIIDKEIFDIAYNKGKEDQRSGLENDPLYMHPSFYDQGLHPWVQNIRLRIASVYLTGRIDQERGCFRDPKKDISYYWIYRRSAIMASYILSIGGLVVFMIGEMSNSFIGMLLGFGLIIAGSLNCYFSRHDMNSLYQQVFSRFYNDPIEDYDDIFSQYRWDHRPFGVVGARGAEGTRGVGPEEKESENP
jgi:hypothetical protein